MDYSFMKDYLAKPNQSLAEHTENLIAHANTLHEMGYISDETLFNNLLFACRYHDIGKMNPLFQERVKDHSKFDESKEVGHHFLSAYLVDLGNELDDSNYKQVTFAVMNHHHYNNDNYEVLGKKKDIIKDLLSRIIEDLIKYNIPITFEQRYKKLSSRKINAIANQENDLQARLLKGFLHKCDYAASSGTEVEYANNFLVENLQAYYTRNQFLINKMQFFCQQNTDHNILITAPTGMGKTEASLYWLGNHKGIYVLPLRTAINEIYKRIKTQILSEEKIDERLGLLHGETFSKYMEEVKEESEYQKSRRYYEETRNLSMPLTVTTPDQIFNFVYHYDGYELKLANLSYSKVIIDEIQAYSPDLLAYLIYGLQSIVEVGGKFAIFTATFPPFIKTLLTKDLTKPVQEQELKFMDGLFDKAFIHDKKRHYIEIKEAKLNVDDIRRVYEREENKKILVVCNTVRQAQDVYEQLQDDCTCKMLHAKFIGKHRAKKENEIMEDGATYRVDGKELNDRKIIWIATQIVEASLDIDFDYLFTELTDLNSLFQRLGRCNRKGAKLLTQPNCFIYTEIDSKLYLAGCKGFIDKTLHLLSKEALKKQGKGIITEQEKQNLIEEYFTYEKIKKCSEFMKQYNYFYKKVADGYSGHINLLKVKEIFRNIISYKAIPKVVYEETYKDEIQRIEDELQKCYESKQEISSVLKLKQVKLERELNGYCLSVGSTDIKKSELLKIGGHEIHIIDGEYSEEIGYQRKYNSEKEKKEEVVEDAYF